MPCFTLSSLIVCVERTTFGRTEANCLLARQHIMLPCACVVATIVLQPSSSTMILLFFPPGFIVVAVVAAAVGCSACAGTSIFGAFFMFLLGVLIKNNYQ
jgi:hypothetical protein